MYRVYYMYISDLCTSIAIKRFTTLYFYFEFVLSVSYWSYPIMQTLWLTARAFSSFKTNPQEVVGPLRCWDDWNTLKYMAKNFNSNRTDFGVTLPPQKLPLPVKLSSILIGPLCWISVCTPRFPQIAPAGNMRQRWGAAHIFQNY